jgi:hypothetical protein
MIRGKTYERQTEGKNKEPINVSFNYLSNGGSGFIEIEKN